MRACCAGSEHERSLLRGEPGTSGGKIKAALQAFAAAHPSDVVGKLATYPVVRVILALGFMWLGWHLFAR